MYSHFLTTHYTCTVFLNCFLFLITIFWSFVPWNHLKSQVFKLQKKNLLPKFRALRGVYVRLGWEQNDFDGLLMGTRGIWWELSENLMRTKGVWSVIDGNKKEFDENSIGTRGTWWEFKTPPQIKTIRNIHLGHVGTTQLGLLTCFTSY
jgi:hypothetical protein